MFRGKSEKVMSSKKKLDGNRIIYAWGLCLGAIAVVLWMIFSDWHSFKGAYLVDPESYSQVEGVVTSTSTYTSKWKSKTLYHYKIEYQFIVGGKVYVSDKITFAGDSSYYPEYAASYIEKYPKGKKVLVFYDTDAPEFSVLEPDNTDYGLKKFFIIVFAIIFLVSGSYLVIRKLLASPI